MINLTSLFGSKAHRVKAQCPNYLKTDKKVKIVELKPEADNSIGIPQKQAASLVPKSDIMEFDIIEVGKNSLDIPEFKQFKITEVNSRLIETSSLTKSYPN